MPTFLGQRIKRREDPRFITGQGRYVDDVRLAGALHVTFLRSPWAHARVLSVDASEAQARSGTHVFTAAQVDLPPEPAPPFIGIDERMHRPPIASDKVRFVGDIVAAVLAESPEASADASELVDIDYDPLPAVTDPVEAARDEVLLFEDVGTNTCLNHPPESPDPRLFDDCSVVTKGALVSQRISAGPIEPRATAAVWEDNRITLWVSTQTPHQDKMALGLMLGLEPEQVRVIAPDVGGGFGGKGLAVEDLLVAYMARATGRPVRWTETRSENLVAMHQGRAQRAEFELGGDSDGRIHALRLRILQDAGAYPSLGAILASFTAMMSSGVYAIPKIETDVTAVATNTTPTGPVRGAGRPEATQMIERAIDLFAADCGLDPAEVRRRNFIATDSDWPVTTASGATYDSGDYRGALDRVLERAGYEELRKEQAARRENGGAVQLGIGLSVYVEITNGIAETEFGAVEMTADGQAIVKTGSFSQGQGHETTYAMIAAEQLGIPVERVTVIKGDTDQVARGTGTYGSKSTQIGGVAAGKAAEEVVERAKKLAAEELEANPEDMELDRERGAFHVTGAPQPALAWADLAGRLQEQNRLAELAAEIDFTAASPTFPFGAHVAVVEVDVETGSTTLKRMIAVDDAGKIINPLVADGQVHGGLAAGIAQALFEELTYDEDGNPRNASFVTYMMPGPAELPNFELVEMETPTPVNPLGAKGIGESGTIGATPAVHNAVLDALAPYGIRHIDMPVNGEAVWSALRDAGVYG
ncbi:MAG TPA: xanthine dehydrogenase family protein molybdopterin-binding subunit [Solirubrobacteraceae bacterium]|jgi:carbon-monoxide dehydrogenase large subunit